MAPITGTVVYRQRVALPSGSIVRVRLEDVSRQDVAVEVVADTQVVTQGEQVPIPFELEVDTAALDAGASYALHASIESEGNMLFVTTTSHPLQPVTAPADMELVVEPVSTLPAPLQATRWALVELGGAAIAQHDNVPYLVFDAAEARFSGSGGCNRLAGSYELSGGSVRVGPVAATRMACAEDVMEREDTFLRVLAATTRYAIDGPSLALLENDRVVARLRAVAA